jgi:hypothetical protein
VYEIALHLVAHRGSILVVLRGAARTVANRRQGLLQQMLEPLRRRFSHAAPAEARQCDQGGDGVAG